MQGYLYEFLGTTLLVLLDDVVATNVILNRTRGRDSGWVVITFEWAHVISIPALIFATSSAVFNSTLVLGLVAIGELDWVVVPGYIPAEVLGGFVGAVLIWVMYKNHFDNTGDSNTRLGIFCTGPAACSYGNNLISEVIATFILAFAILGIVQTPVGDMAAVGIFGVDAIIFACGASLGGTTGYTTNPARDFGSHTAHAILPISNKRDSDWSYTWIPIVGPICGGLLGAWLVAAVL